MRHLFWHGIILGLLGLLIPESSGAQVITSGPASCPGIALTFDLCPVKQRPGFDHALVDYLEEHHIPATFFMSGKWMAKHDTDVAHLLGIGFFEVGTHGEVHAHLPLHTAEEQREEIARPVRFLQDRYTHRATLFRPPYGEYNDTTVDVVKQLGLRFIQWNIVSGDPDPTLTAEQILARIETRAKPGSIVVLHANGKGKYTHAVIERLTTDILPRKGLTPMTVSALLACEQKTP